MKYRRLPVVCPTPQDIQHLEKLWADDWHVTPQDIQLAEKLWAEGVTRAKIAEELGIALWMLDELRRRGPLRHLAYRRGYVGGNYNRSRADREPGPQEVQAIERRRKEVRDGWTPDERHRRWVGADRVPWSVPQLLTHHREPHRVPRAGSRYSRVYRAVGGDRLFME